MTHTPTTPTPGATAQAPSRLTARNPASADVTLLLVAANDNAEGPRALFDVVLTSLVDLLAEVCAVRLAAVNVNARPSSLKDRAE